MVTSQQIVLSVTGMSCGSCVRHVREALTSLEGVRDVQVELSSGKVVVDRDSASTSPETMIAALQRAGYEASTALIA